MTALEQLQTYLRRLELRLRILAVSRGALAIAAMALVLTVLLVAIGNRLRFAEGVVWPLRILLFAALATTVSFALALPLWRLNRRWVTRLAEKRVPGFAERLLTIVERPDASNPFTELVAEDAMRVAREHQPEEFSPNGLLAGVAGSAVVTVAILVWLVAAGPGYWGYGASLLWTGNGNAAKRPLYEVLVKPGDKTVRRKSDQLVTAQLEGFSAREVTLHARYGGAPKWETTSMQARPAGSGYQFLFAGLSDPVEYYVEAEGTRSKHYKLAVRDLPGVKRVRVALHYPKGLGLRDQVDDPGGDIRAVEGSEAEISVLTDRPLRSGTLLLENGAKTELKAGDGNWLTARLPITKDGAYHVATLDQGEMIRISQDYFIEAKKDEAPSVKISRPGGDPRVTPIEEVPVTVEAADDFGVDGLELHYAVNGGAEQVIPLLKTKGTHEAVGKTMLSLESFKMVPGDVIAMYAAAKDAKTTTRSDILFAEAQPFDFKFTQSQQAGGGGGGGMGNQEGQISERQKQIIAATWNEIRSGGGKAALALKEDAQFLSDTQGKLSEQAKTLAERMGNRELAGASKEFENFSKLMTDASAQMNNAVGQLKPGKWRDALPPEQKALQSLLRAEALFRNIQVAFGQQGGGGGGGGGAQRDLARMFDLELDTTKNQYETGQQSEAEKASEQQKAIDDAFEKLKELARRQQELAQQSNQQQAFEQRWQQEQLRREAEEMRRQMEQLSRNSQGQQQEGSQQQQQQQQGQQGQPGQQQSSSSSGSGSAGQSQSRASARGGQQSGQQSREMKQALDRSMEALRRAEDEMRKAVSGHDATAERRAAEQLAEAQNLLNKALGTQAGNSASEMAQRAQEIASAQRDLARRMREMYGAGPESEGRRSAGGDGGEEMPQMNDPNARRMYRRYYPGIQPRREPTQEEKQIAGEKEKLAQQLEQLQQQMQKQAESLAGTQPDLGRKMRNALSDAEQKELALRMQKNGELLRQGYGDRNLEMEGSVTMALDDLTRELRDIQQALKAGGQGDRPGKGNREAETLARLRSLRESLERSQQNAQGGQPGGQRPGQQPGGQQPGQQNGSQQGGSQQSASQQSGSQQNGSQQGGAYSPNGGGGAGMDRRGLQDAISGLNSLRGRLDPNDRAFRGYVDNTLGSLRTLNADPRLLDSAISQDAVTSLERLEVELGRRLGEQGVGGARTGAPEASPEKYRDAVAEYFKKLSQGR
jgi:hypothetical protein